MFRVKTLFLFSMLAASQLVWTASADAGPLLDWIRSRRCFRAARTCPPVAPTTANYGSCTTTCQKTCQRVVVNYVPYTAYRTNWERVPVTTYRQSTSTDPCTGCTVTCNRPCTTYSWRMRQEPFTTYRPVYRTETYQVPVTYTTPAPAAAPACNTCALPAQPQLMQASPGTTVSPYYQPGTTTGGAVYEPTPATGTTLVPADSAPSLNPQNMQKPVLEIENGARYVPPQSTQPASSRFTPIPDPDPGQRWNHQAAPQLLNPFDKSAHAPSVRRWSYSPVQLASYEAPVRNVSDTQPRGNRREYVGTIQGNTQTDLRVAKPARRVNEGWRRD